MANFNEAGLRKKLEDLNMSQQSIQTMSLWLIHHKKHAHVVVNIWYKELVKAPDARKLAFMYLANDVIQNGKKKGPEYTKEFLHRLPKAFKHLSTIKLNEKALNGLKRLLQVWEERGVFESDNIKDFKKRLGVYQKENHPEKKSSAQEAYVPKKSKRKSKAIKEDDFPVALDPEETMETSATPIAKEELTRSASPPITPKAAFTPIISSQTTPVINPPEAEELIKALQDLENAATADAEVRKKIANLPSSISDISGLNKLQDVEAGNNLVVEVDKALDMLETYNKRLLQEMDARKAVAKLLHDYISHQKDVLSQTEETLEQHRQKLSKVQKVRQELKAHLQNLPDISKLPSLGGTLAPLPSAGDLFT